MGKHTPMIEQYLKIKKQHENEILFFRLGDFYEMFFEDAELAARELEIVLTARGSSKAKIPMCGVPYHSADNYIAKLINLGYRIAICEQVEDPRSAKGIVKREVVKIITPGTVIDEEILDKDRNNYLAAIISGDGKIGFSYIDISTGDFWVTEFTGSAAEEKLLNELNRISPAECLVKPKGDFPTLWGDKFEKQQNTLISYIDEEVEFFANDLWPDSLCSEDLLAKGYTCGIKALQAIIFYLHKTQKSGFKHIKKVISYDTDFYLEMDNATQRNLELTATIRDGKREGSLLGVIDHCQTAMGKRLLRQFIEQPLRDIEKINARLDGIEELVSDLVMRTRLQECLAKVYDMERLAGKIGSEQAKPRDLIALKLSIMLAQEIKEVLQGASSSILQQLARADLLDEVRNLIEKSIDDEASINIKAGGIIKKGYNPEIDELRELSRDGSKWLLEFEQNEKQRTGMKYLKVGYNRVFGYYLEVSKSNLHLVPDNYHRKQTLVNTERFICEELKNYEDRILSARERLYNLELDEFQKVREKLSEYLAGIQEMAHIIAHIDVIFGLSTAAYLNDYTRPVVDESQRIEIRAGRHPVVEKSLLDSRFVPNDVKMNMDEERFAIITGPNMGGKSTFMRQVAIIVIMAQMGSFVPADNAVIGICDKLFTRVGAADDLARGQSTFMVEMLEVAHILNNATSSSLIILDEIGRGTSTYDGLSIALAVSKYIHECIKAKTLFATHYHELTSLSDDNEGMKNLSVSVKETGDTVVFLKKVLPGKADKSYGIHVAMLAGLPSAVTNKAEEILLGLEEKDLKAKDLGENLGREKEIVEQPELFREHSQVIEELKSLDPDELSPKQALKYLYRWKEMA